MPVCEAGPISRPVQHHARVRPLPSACSARACLRRRRARGRVRDRRVLRCARRGHRLPHRRRRNAAGRDRIRFAPYRERFTEMPIADRRPYAFTWRFATVEAPGKLSDLMEAAERLEPDLLVYESADLAAPIGAALGITSVHHGFGRLVPVACYERAAPEVEALWRGVGLEPEPLCGAFRGSTSTSARRASRRPRCRRHDWSSRSGRSYARVKERRCPHGSRRCQTDPRCT